MPLHGYGLPTRKGKLVRKSVETQLHQMPEPTEKNVNTVPPQQRIQKKNVSVFNKSHILYSCHKTDEDFPCVSWNCSLQHSLIPASLGGTPEHGLLSDATNEVPVTNSINWGIRVMVCNQASLIALVSHGLLRVKLP